MQTITNGSLDDLDLPDNEFNRLPDAEFDRILQALREWEAENHERNVALSAPVADDLVLPLLRYVDGLFKEVLAEEITRCFGVDGTKDLIRHPGSNNAEIALQSSRLGEGGNTAPFKYALSMTQKGSQLTTAISEAVPLRVAKPPKKYGYSSRLLSWRNNIDRMAGVSEVSEHLANSVLSCILGPISRPAHYLPADRTGVMHAHRVLVSSLINRASRSRLRRDDSLPDLSGVVADFLNQLIELGDLAGRRRNKADALAKHIEAPLQRGPFTRPPTPSGRPGYAVADPNHPSLVWPQAAHRGGLFPNRRLVSHRLAARADSMAADPRSTPHLCPPSVAIDSSEPVAPADADVFYTALGGRNHL